MGYSGQNVERSGLPVARQQIARLLRTLGCSTGHNASNWRSSAWQTASGTCGSLRGCAIWRRTRSRAAPTSRASRSLWPSIGWAKCARPSDPMSACPSTFITDSASSRAAEFCRKVECHDLMFLEEPIRSESPEAYAALRRMTSMPFAIGEEFSSKWAFLPFIY